MNRNVLGCLLAALIVFLIGSLGLNMLQFMAIMGQQVIGMPQPKEKLTEKVHVEGNAKSKEKIVHIDLEGVISSMDAGGFLSNAVSNVDSIKRSLDQALADESVKAIVLRINSPGGEVTASDVIYAAVKKAAEQKPVIVYMDSVAASGGYYVACGATKVIATETTITASIGVIMESMSYHDLFNKVGLGTQTFTSGAFKDTLSGSRPMRDDEKVYIQNLVNTMYDRFLGIVSEARGVSKEVLKSTVADGRVVTGRQALEAKLVDQIGYVEDAYALAKDLGKSPDATIIKYQNIPNLFSVLGMASSKAEAPAKVELDLTGGTLPKLQPGLMYYLPTAYLR
jgi:protease-4